MANRQELRDRPELPDDQKSDSLVPVEGHDGNGWYKVLLTELEGIDQMARDAAAAAATAAGAAQTTANENRVEIKAEETARRRGDDELARRIAGISTDIADGSITTPKLADDAVTRAKLADDSVGGREIVSREVSSGHLADRLLEDRHFPTDIIDARMIEANAVGLSELAGKSVDVDNLTDALRLEIDGKLTASRLETAMETLFRDNFNLDDLPGFMGLNIARDDNGKALILEVAQDGTVSVGKRTFPTGSSGGVDNVARTEAGRALDQIADEVINRKAGDARLQHEVDSLRSGAGPVSDLIIDPSRIDNPAALNNLTFTVQVDDPDAVSDQATRAVLAYVRPGRSTGAPIGSVQAWDADVNSMRFTVTSSQFTKFTTPGSDNYIGANPRHIRLALWFFPATGATNDASLAVSEVQGTLNIYPASQQGVPFTQEDSDKLDRYDGNPQANGAAFSQPLVLLQQHIKVALDNAAFTADNVRQGQFQARAEGTGPTARDILKLALHPDDVESVDYWLAEPLAPVVFGQADGGGVLSVTPEAVNRPDDTAKPWLFRFTFPAGSGVLDLPNERYNVQGNPKVAGGGGGLTGPQAEDYLFDPADKAALGFAGELVFDIGNPDDANLVTETDAYSSGFRMPPVVGGEITVDYVLDGTITGAQPVDADLVLERAGDGSDVATHNLVLPDSSGTMKIPADGLSNVNLRFAIRATTKGRFNGSLVLSDLAYSSSESRAAPFVREIMDPVLSGQQKEFERQREVVEQELVAGDAKLASPTRVGARRSPTWAAATSTHQDQTDADSFVIPASGYAQVHWSGEIAGELFMHVDDWKVPQTITIHNDASGRIQLICDGTRVRFRNRNAAGNGAYPNQSLLLLGRGFQWLTWPENPTPGSSVTLLTEAQVRALIPAPPAVVQAHTAGSVTVNNNNETTLQTARITPRSNTTRVRVSGGLTMESAGGQRQMQSTVRLYRGSTLLLERKYGDTQIGNNQNEDYSPQLEIIDSPGSNAEQTYTLRVLRTGNRVWSISRRVLIVEEVL